jgi:hypothetical protein
MGHSLHIRGSGGGGLDSVSMLMGERIQGWNIKLKKTMKKVGSRAEASSGLKILDQNPLKKSRDPDCKTYTLIRILSKDLIE